MRALYDEALAGLGTGYESLTVATRLGETHVLALGSEDAPPAVPMLRIIADGDDVRLRSGPGSGYDTVARIPNGCLVESTGPPDFGWLPIRWRQDEGWIYGGYVEHADPGEADCQ